MKKNKKPRGWQPFRKGDLVHVTGVAYTKDAPWYAQHGVNGVGEDGRWMPGTIFVREVLDVKEKSTGRVIGYGRPLVVFPANFDGIVVGWTTRRSGVVYPAHPGQGHTAWGYDEGTPGSLENIQVHKVWMVEPIDTDRWSPPAAVLPEYMEISKVQLTVMSEIRRKMDRYNHEIEEGIDW